MKTIQIPMSSNPFTVVINNSVYQYKAGQTMEVPDEVAAAIEDALKLVPKPGRYLNKLAQRAEGSLTELEGSDLWGIETIASYAFAHCETLQKVAIPNSVKLIKNHAFYGCTSLKSANIAGVTTMGEYAFYGCTALISVELPETPPALTNSNAFNKIKTSCMFYCKTQESLNAYKAAENWSTLAGTYSFVVES